MHRSAIYIQLCFLLTREKSHDNFRNHQFVHFFFVNFDLANWLARYFLISLFDCIRTQFLCKNAFVSAGSNYFNTFTFLINRFLSHIGIRSISITMNFFCAAVNCVFSE